MPIRTTKNGNIVDCFKWNEGQDYDEPHSLIPDGGLIRWNNNPFTWDDVCLALEVNGAATAWGDWETAFDKLDEPKKLRYITLWCRIKGETEIIKQKKLVKSVKLKADDIQLVTETILGKKLTLESVEIK